MEKDREYHMTIDEFRRRGREIIDWIAGYREKVGDLPVRSRAEPGSIRERLPRQAPESGEPFDEVLADLDDIILPGITHWQSPDFFGYFPSNASEPSVLGELLSAGLGVQGMLWATSPACTELETHVLDWLVDMLDLPRSFLSTGRGGGVIQDTASSATLCALLAAREKASGFRCGETGYEGSLTVYASTQAHSSVEKAVRIAGIGSANLRAVGTDGRYGMDAAELARLIERDRKDGLTPCFVCGTVGTTSSLAFDPIAEIGPVCRENGVWLHVDAAMAGTAALCPEYRFVNEGLEHADSYCFNPHKWMFTNFDCDCFWVADRSVLVRTLSILPEYLRNAATESGKVIDYRDWHIPLGRRFRALKLWMVIRHYGVKGLRHHVRRHVELARWFAGQIEGSGRFELAARPRLNLVCFRHVSGDDTTRRIMERVNAEGEIFLTHTELGERFTLRLSVGQTRTGRENVEKAWRVLNDAAGELE